MLNHNNVLLRPFSETEADIISPHPGWAEQSPDQWWEHVKQAILKCHAKENMIHLISVLLVLLTRCMDWYW